MGSIYKAVGAECVAADRKSGEENPAKVEDVLDNGPPRNAGGLATDQPRVHVEFPEVYTI